MDGEGAARTGAGAGADQSCHELGYDLLASGRAEGWPQPLLLSSRCCSRFQSRSFIVSRLSCTFLPRASASSTLALPLPLKYIDNGTSVSPWRVTAPCSLAISRPLSNSLRCRLGSWLSRLPWLYSGMWLLISQISSPSAVA